MKITYDILKDLLRCNSGIKLEYRNNSNTLDIYMYNNLVSTIQLNSNNIEVNSEIIYNTIINLENITIYIPKIYIK